MTSAGESIEVLEAEESLALLGQQTVGRVGLSVGALPVVLPVNYVLDGGRIVLRSGFGTKLSAALRNAVVCFEVDDIDREHHAGWSVVITGTARELVGAEATHAASLPLQPWTGGDGDRYIAISIELISGRRVGINRLIPATVGPSREQ